MDYIKILQDSVIELSDAEDGTIEQKKSKEIEMKVKRKRQNKEEEKKEESDSSADKSSNQYKKRGKKERKCKSMSRIKETK